MCSHRTDTPASMIISEEVWAPWYCAAYISNVDRGGCTDETDAVLLLRDRIWKKRSWQFFPSHAINTKNSLICCETQRAFCFGIHMLAILCFLDFLIYAPSWPDVSTRCALDVKNVAKRSKSDGATIIVSSPSNLCFMRLCLSFVIWVFYCQLNEIEKTKTFFKKYLKVE